MDKALAQLQEEAKGGKKSSSRSKPWRYACVFVFPNTKFIRAEELNIMNQKSKTIQQHEDEYLQHIVAMNPLNRVKVEDSPLNILAKTMFDRMNTLLIIVGIAMVLLAYSLYNSNSATFIHTNTLFAFFIFSVAVLAIAILGKLSKNTIGPRILKLLAAVVCILGLIQLWICYRVHHYQDTVHLIIRKEEFNQAQLKMNQPINATVGVDEQEIMTALKATFKSLYSVDYTGNDTSPLWFSLWMNESCASPSTLPAPVAAPAQVQPIASAPAPVAQPSKTQVPPPAMPAAQSIPQNQVTTPAMPTIQSAPSAVATAPSHRQLLSIVPPWVSFKNTTHSPPPDTMFELCKVPLVWDLLRVVQLIWLISCLALGLESILFISIFLIIFTTDHRERLKKKTGYYEWIINRVWFLTNSTLMLCGAGSIGVMCYGLVVQGMNAMQPPIIELVPLFLLWGTLAFFVGFTGLATTCIRSGMCSKCQLYLVAMLLVVQTLIMYGVYMLKGVTQMIFNGDPRLRTFQRQILLSLLRQTVDALYFDPHLHFIAEWIDSQCNVPASRNSQDPDHISKFLPCAIQLSPAFYQIFSISFSVLVVLSSFELVIFIRLWFKFSSRKPKHHGIPRRRKSSNTALDDAENQVPVDSISFADGLARYLDCIPQGQHVKLKVGKQEFIEAWKASAGGDDVEDQDLLLMPQYQAICRRLIINRLRLHCKFDLAFEFASNGKQIYCKIAASDQVLAAHAAATNYRLQVNEAVDPGYEFWTNSDNLARDRMIYDRETVKNKLSMMYMKNLIPKSEYQLFRYESPVQWSLRLHVHEREQYYEERRDHPSGPAIHLQYFNKPQLQYLYKRYRTQLDGNDRQLQCSLFRTADRLVLIKQLIEEQYNPEELVSNLLVQDYTCLHAASKYDVVNLLSLREMWITFWKPMHLPGEFKMNSCCFQYLRRIYPFRQPISSIRDYFGEQIGLYFCWIGFYAELIMFPAIACLILVFLACFKSASPTTSVLALLNTHAQRLEHLNIVMCLLIMLWSFIYPILWQRKNALIKLKWGMDGFEATERVRPEFNGVKQWNGITNTYELQFPTSRRVLRQALSFTFLTTAASVMVAWCFLCFSWQNRLIQACGMKLGIFLGQTLQIISIRFHPVWFHLVLERLNDWENYQTDTEYEDAMILKIFFLESINMYAPLFFIGFVKKNIFGCMQLDELILMSQTPVNIHGNLVNEGNCLEELEMFLIYVFIMRMLWNVYELGKPVVLQWYNSYSMAKLNASAAPDQMQCFELEHELTLDTYENTFEDYTEMVIQYGLVVMFNIVFPLIPIVAFIESTLEIRVDAYKLCNFMRRPFPDPAEDIGTWQTYLVYLSHIGIWTNFGLLFLTASNFSHVSHHRRSIMFFLASCTGEIIYLLIQSCLAPEPTASIQLRKRQEFLHKKYFQNTFSSPQDTPTGLAVPPTQKATPIDSDQTILQERMGLLGKFNQLYKPPKSSAMSTVTEEIELPAPSAEEIQQQEDGWRPEGESPQGIEDFEVTELEGMDAVREVVRRGMYRFPEGAATIIWPEHLPRPGEVQPRAVEADSTEQQGQIEPFQEDDPHLRDII